MNTNVYGFRPGRSVKNIAPQELGQALEDLRVLHGKLTAEIVVEAAKDESSVLHAAFTWDDAEAAQQHRLNEARRLITCIQVVNSPVGLPIQAFPEVGRTYAPAAEVLSNDQLAQRVLLQVKEFIESLERKYSAFHEVKNALDALKRAAG
jgi:hypothetical protein